MFQPRPEEQRIDKLEVAECGQRCPRPQCFCSKVLAVRHLCRPEVTVVLEVRKSLFCAVNVERGRGGDAKHADMSA